jgi:hypothetical protein
MKSLLKIIQYDLLDFIEGEDDPIYSSSDVTSCIKLLLNFLTTIDGQEQSIESAKTHVHELVLSLNALNEKCHSALIDSGQRDDIVNFINIVLLSVNITIDGDMTAQWRTW